MWLLSKAKKTFIFIISMCLLKLLGYIFKDRFCLTFGNETTVCCNIWLKMYDSISGSVLSVSSVWKVIISQTAGNHRSPEVFKQTAAMFYRTWSTHKQPWQLSASRGSKEKIQHILRVEEEEEGKNKKNKKKRRRGGPYHSSSVPFASR